MSEGPSAADSLLDTLPIGVVILDTGGRVLLWSPTTEDLLGWTGEEATGRRFVEFLAPAHRDASPALRIYGELRRGRVWRGFLTAMHRSGRQVEVQAQAALLEDADGEPFILGNVVKMSSLRAIEHDLAALDALFDSSPLGIALFDEQKRFVRVNRALMDLYKVKSDESLIGRTVEDVLPNFMSAEISDVQSVVLETGATVVDMVMPAPDGRGARSVSYSRLNDRSGGVIGVSCVIMDITERRDAQDKVERARQRLSLLDDVSVALGDLMDVRKLARALARALVPRFADYAAVMLRGEVFQGDELPGALPQGGAPLLQLGVAGKSSPRAGRMLRAGQDIALAPDSFFATVLRTGRPHLAGSQRELLAATYRGDPKVQAALDLGIHSLMCVPLSARGIVLGLLVISRAEQREGYDEDDIALAMEAAGRAGISLDNARLYAREREGALMLQRSLLPQRVPSPPGVQVGFRYVPGSSGTEVGGDWFDVIPLAAGRVALVVGDVMGHGLRAAATMGRLRTAVRTLAPLEVPPHELLGQINDLADDLAQGPEEPLMATCVYAVYDPSTRRVTFAMAGHVPPMLVSSPSPDGQRRAELLEMPAGAPLGVGGVSFESVEVEVEQGAVLVLYTDGLVETRGEDITDGLGRLRERLSRQSGAGKQFDIEDACDDVIAMITPADDAPPTRADDAALLMAQLGGLGESSSASWSFPAERLAVRRARQEVRHTLERWRLEELVDEAMLLVSELFTNSLRYAHGPIGVRMVGGTSSLLVEVSDPLPDPPRERVPGPDDEGGRGIQLVAQSARRWGTRRGPAGKTVWFELDLPSNED